MPLAVASAAIMMTVGVAMIEVLGTGIVMGTVKTGTRDGMRGVRREVRLQCINTYFAQHYL